MAHPETCSLKEFARIAGVVPSYVTELKRTGRLVLTDDGKRVRVAPSLQLIQDTRDPTRAAVSARHANARGSEVALPNAAPGDMPDGGEAPDDDQDEPDRNSPYHEYRAETERYRSLAARRDYERSMGQLMPTDEVLAAVGAAATLLRRTLEQLPDNLAPQIAPLSDERKVRDVLIEAVEEALQELSRQFSLIAKAVEE